MFCIVIMDCDICCEPYENDQREPKILTQCGHTLCTSCIESLRRISGNDLTCPQCRVVTSISQIRTNFAIKGLMEQSGATGKHNTLPDRPGCVSHADEPVTVFCIPCKQFICKECFETVDSIHSAHARVSFKDGLERIRGDLEETHYVCDRIKRQNEQELARLHVVHHELSKMNDACIIHFNLVVERFKKALMEVQGEFGRREAIIRQESAHVVNRLNTAKAIEQLVSSIKTDVQTNLNEYIGAREGLTYAMNCLESDTEALDAHFDEVSISGTVNSDMNHRSFLPRVVLTFPDSYDLFRVDKAQPNTHPESQLQTKRRPLHRKTSNDELNG
jgi:hypothetical protein